VVTFKIDLDLCTFSDFMVERISGAYFALSLPLRSSRFSARFASFSAPLTFCG